MDLAGHFHQQLEYNAWANREVAVALTAAGDQSAASVRLLAHIIGAEHVWLARLKGFTPPLAVWPELSIDQCEKQIAELHDSFTDYFRSALPAAFEGVVSYKNSKGETWSSRVDDIVTHLFLHSAYHRGQIALQMRHAGLTPPYTDFIHGVRQKLFSGTKA